MRFDEDTRGQSVLIGSILLFAILIIAFASYQAAVVPSQNAEVEFNHNNDVQSDMQDLRNSLLDVRSVERVGSDYEIVSEHRPVRVRAGTQYPSRLIALNPPHPVGELQAETPESEISIDNANVRTPDAYEGDPEGLLEDLEGGLETRFLEYRPGYNEYHNAPETTLEHSLLYNSFDERDLVVRNQRVIEDRRLNLILFDGEPRQAIGQTATLDPETLDGPTAPITIEDDGDPIELTIPTEAPELWESDEVIGESFTEGATRARVIDSDDQTVTIELDPDETYQLRVARVGFDGGQETNQFTPIQTKEAEPGEGGTASPAYDIFWEPGEMDSTDGFDCSQDECEILVGATEETKIGTTPETVAGFAEFAALDGSIGGFPDGNTLAFDHTVRPITHDFRADEIGETEIIVLAGDDRDELDIEVYGEGTLEGTVSDSQTGAEIEGAEVTVEQTGQTDITNAQGDYEIAEIREGTYTVTATANGYQSGEETDVEISHDTITQLPFALDPVPEDGAFFEVEITDAPEEVTEGDEVTVEYTIENVGDETATQDIEFRVDDQIEDTEPSVELDSGQTFSGSFVYQTDGDDVPDIEVTVVSDDDSDSRTVTVGSVDSAQPSLSNLNIAGQGTDATITGGDAGNIDVDVENVGDESGSFTIELGITNGQTVTETETTSQLAPGGSETVTFTDPISGLSPDEYAVTVSDGDDISSVSGTLLVEESQDAADNIQVTSSSTTGAGGSVVQFTLDNTRGDAATIEQISVDSVTNTAQTISAPGGNAELTQEGADRLNQDIQIGGPRYTLDTQAEISGNDDSGFTFNRFRDGNGDAIGMGGTTIEITLVFTDGSEGTYTLQP